MGESGGVTILIQQSKLHARAGAKIRDAQVNPDGRLLDGQPSQETQGGAMEGLRRVEWR